MLRTQCSELSEEVASWQVLQTNAAAEHVRAELGELKSLSARQERTIAAQAEELRLSQSSLAAAAVQIRDGPRNIANSNSDSNNDRDSNRNGIGDGANGSADGSSVVEQLANSSRAWVGMERMLKKSDRLLSDVESLQATVAAERAKTHELAEQLQMAKEQAASTRSQHAFEIQELSSWADGLLDGFHQTIDSKQLQ
eukprot:SAG22_NODE_2910_length_2110_cov_1.295375_1_plen_197_part_00